MPGKASAQITVPKNQLATTEQAPSDGSLPCFIIIPSPLAKVMNGNQIERGVSWFGNADGNGTNHPSIAYGGATW
jgi:hypothetical protein